MRNIKINEAETIFETFWDGGESYPENEKYSCLVNYKITATKNAHIRQDWASVEIKFTSDNEKLIIERDCILGIEGYDVFRVCASLSENINLKVICCIDGKYEEVIKDVGKNKNKEYNGKISGKLISHIKIEFECCKTGVNVGNLLWMGLSDSEKEKKMLSEKTPYDENWEGCFSATYNIQPEYGIYFDENELIDLRVKLSTHPFSAYMDLLRKEANEALKLIPENDVGDYVHKKFLRFIRERDVDKTVLVEEMQKLAFVGIIDENYQMLKMACRMALSVAHCRYFCESIIGVFPGATWHHRSFTEESVCKALLNVLEWAGGLLTWHGKNIIYDAVIMKGLPRLDADIKTMDYIWGMNQGTAFASSLVITLIILSKRYPRYESRVYEAEKDMFLMWENYVYSDGGSLEGPQYWAFTLSQMLDAVNLLARYRKLTVREYAPKSIKNALKYATAVFSEKSGYYIPVNDAHLNLSFGGNLLTFLANVSGENTWKKMSNNFLYTKPLSTDGIINYMIFAQEFEETETVVHSEYVSLPVSGISKLKRKSEKNTDITLYTICEKVIFGHSHADKGSFILEADGKPLLIDRGVCDYNNPYVRTIQLSEVHNMIVAEKNGEFVSQNVSSEKTKVKVIQDEYINNVYLYGADVTEAWGGAFVKNIRRIVSPSPNLYLIIDDLILSEGYSSAFILNAYSDICSVGNNFLFKDDTCKLLVSPLNWKPEKSLYEQFGIDGIGKAVNRLCMYAKAGVLVTAIEVIGKEESKLKIENLYNYIYDDIHIKLNENGVVINEKEYLFNIEEQN